MKSSALRTVLNDAEHHPATWHRELFGLSVSMNFAPRYTLLPSSSVPVLSMKQQFCALPAKSPAPPLYRSRNQFSDGSPVLTISRCTRGDLLDFHHVAQFLVDEHRIRVHPCADASPDLVAGRLFGPVMAYWLETRATTVLHASAVVTTTGAMAFLSHNGGGKSTLAAAMIRHGNRLLADDVLAVVPGPEAVRAYPAYPEMRMWPDIAGLFIDDLASLDSVHPDSPKLRIPIGIGKFGEFCAAPTALRALYLPCRELGRKTPVIEPLSPSDAARSLIRHSLVPHLAALTRDPGERLDAVVRMANALPVKRIRFGDDLSCLDEVCGCLSADMTAVCR